MINFQHSLATQGGNISTPHNMLTEAGPQMHIHPSSSLGAFQVAQLMNQMDNRVREDPKIRVTLNFGTPPVSNINLRPPKVSHQKNKVLTGSKTLLKPIKQITHNLSAINLRNPEMSPPYPRRKTAQQVINEANGKRSPQRQALARFFQNKRTTKENCKEYMKKPKEAPSFIRRKQIKSCYEEQGIKILKKLGEHCYLTLHPDSNFLLVMDVKNKKDVLGDRSCFSALRVYLKNCDIDHNLLVKYFGFLTDQDHICLFEEYLEGETLEHCINNPREDFNESTIGPIICSILTAIEYFRSIGKPYGIISPRNILYSMNICKFKRDILIDENLVSQSKDLLFDIWCIGKLAYELVTHEQLLPEEIMKNVKTIDDIFNSKEITKYIEVGFKRFQEKTISRELIEFLIITLWTIQTKEISLEKLWNLQFVKLYHEEDVWCSPTKEENQSP